jgi:hypothetical protein
MGQEVANRQGLSELTTLFTDGQVFKIRKVFRHRIIDRQSPFVLQNHDGGRAQRLRQGSDPKETVGFHRPTAREIGLPDGPEVENAVAIGNERHGTRKLGIVDKLLHDGLDSLVAWLHHRFDRAKGPGKKEEPEAGVETLWHGISLVTGTQARRYGCMPERDNDREIETPS